MSESGLYIGIDAGGSKTELLARAFPEENIFTCVDGPANLKKQGIENVVRVFADLIGRARVAFPGTVLRSICAGVAGAHASEDCVLLQRTLQHALQPAQPLVTIVNDGIVALDAALQDRSGLIIIAGTGSLVLGRTADRRIVRAGGWGYLLGDEGSGYALGLAGLRAIVRAEDGGPQTTLVQRLAETHHLSSTDDLVQSVYLDSWNVAQFARSVLDAAAEEDEVARTIVFEQTRLLAGQVGLVLAREPGTGRILQIFGGLSHDSGYVSMLTRHLHDLDPTLEVSPSSRRPVEGALYRALTIASSTPSGTSPTV